MKKIFFCVSLALTGLMASCVDKYEEVDAESKPARLGSNIYAELENPSPNSGLTGTFKNYLQLIVDLKEDETLKRTGSKTVFPANDEAFARFFANNDWGVKEYADLSAGQKKLLLYSSMLDNPLLLQLLPNVSNGTAEPMNGMALKHTTNVQVIDTIQLMRGREDMPANNPYWEPFYGTGVEVVSDATRPMMIHLTREFMVNNGITTLGSGSDFEILTGTPYPEEGNTAFIFNNQVITPDVTCQNGYIHQVNEVVVPPGNMAQVLRRKDNTKYMSRILDYFAVPVLAQTVVDNYNQWADKQDPKLPHKSAIYAMRYLSDVSYNSESAAEVKVGANTRINGNIVSNVLSYDPSWNGYYPRPARGYGDKTMDYAITDMGAFFVPSDQALTDYFVQKSPTEKGLGAYLIDIYGNYKYEQNTPEHLAENLDSLHSKNPEVLADFVNNLLNASFVASVPSKFDAVMNDASENLGLKVDLIETKNDGKYDITFANNGAVYVMKELLAPDKYNSVQAPASVYEDMRVMNWAVQDRTPLTEGASLDYHLGVDFRFYLLSMSSNYGFFIPDDAAFDLYYLDPASLGHHVGNNVNNAAQPEVLHFYYDPTLPREPKLQCERYYVDLETGQPIGSPRIENNMARLRTQLIDILNYHTVVLPAERDASGNLVAVGYNGNHYYKTKHGAEIYVEGSANGSKVMSGVQIENPDAFPAGQITETYSEKNGYAYRMNRVIQPTTASVYSVLSDEERYPQFSEFFELCDALSDENLLEWVGIDGKRGGDEGKGTNAQDAYAIFTNWYRTPSDGTEDACLDKNVRMFNTYNYTLFAPDNTAMKKAYDEMGLPRWSDVEALMAKWDGKTETTVSAEEQSDKDKAKDMIDAIRDFVRYHFVMGSVYADNVIDLSSPRCRTMTSDEYGVSRELNITGGNGRIVVTDGANHTIEVNGGDNSRLVNKMTRDYWLGQLSNDVMVPCRKTVAHGILTSSFCVIHQISEPLTYKSQLYPSRAK